MGVFDSIWEQFESSVDSLDAAQKTSYLISFISSLVLIVVVLIFRRVVARALRKNKRLSQEIRRRWMVQLRNGAFLLILLGLMVIWADTLRVMAVYVLAVAMAFVIATKELIQCFTGSMMRVASKAFEIGDRIEIGDYRGDVIDTGALTTTILEIGPGELTHRLTGRAVAIPNSMFLDKPVINETFTDDYVLHVFTLPMKMCDDWQQAEQDLLSITTEQSASYIEQARKHFQKLGKREGLAVLSVDPRVTFSVPKAGEVELIVRFAVPAREKGKIEQEILRRFLMLTAERNAAKKVDKEARPPSPEVTAPSADSLLTPTSNAAAIVVEPTA